MSKLKTAVKQSQKGQTVDVRYRRKRDGKTILRNVGVVEIRGGKVWVQDQDDDGKVKSLLVSNIIAITPSKNSFNDSGYNRYKKD